jgi:hypothetical protein
MKHCRGLACGVLATLAAQVTAEFSSWDKNEINTTICNWKQPRAALVRDVVYLDGGDVWWSPGLDDESVGTPKNTGNFEGLIFTYNLSEPFSPDTNVTGILLKNTVSKALGGESGSTPFYEDGGMLANDAEFFLYGGDLFRNRELYDDPDSDEVMMYAAYSYGLEKSLFHKGFNDRNLDNDVTRYVSYGAAASAPSENKGWYFSGLTSPTHGPIYSNSGSSNDDNMAVNVSNHLITVDMKTQYKEEWSNDTLPSSVKGRSNAEAIWVPVGEEGILVIVGGVVYPEWAGTVSSHQSDDEEASKKESPKFMSEIDIYDVANKKWYKQETKGSPGTRTRGCAVVQPAADLTSFNIYYYGGYDGLGLKGPFYDDVWVLSLPSFTWTQINKGSSLHARAGHKCFSPYPDQMMVFGGYPAMPGSVPACLDDGPVVIFNTTSGEWMDSYDPTKYNDYGVPDKVQSAIGGHASGGATVTAPVSGGWAKGLDDVFAKSYDMDKISTYYPYKAASSTSRPDLPNDNDDDDNGGGLPKWVAPVLGVVLGLMLVTGLVVIFCLWRRRKIFKHHPSDHGTEDAGMRILTWMRGQQPAEKAPTVTSSDETTASPDMIEEARAIGSEPSIIAPMSSRFEMEDTQVVELGDTSPPLELHGTALSPAEIIDKHTHFASNKPRTLSNPSYSSFSAGAERDFNSSISHSSAVMNSSAARSDQAESPAPGATPEPTNDRVTSGVSSMTERAASHLRQISETSVGSTGMHPMVVERPPASRAISEGTEPITTPVSPPTGDESPAEDYISARDTVSPIRRSMFHENEEDMAGGK